MKTLSYPLIALCTVSSQLLMAFGALGQAQDQPRARCLSYAPAEVRLEGALIGKTFAGPPNYEDINKGDKAETYWLLKLASPICVDQGKMDPELDGAVKNVRTVELVVPAGFYKSKVKLVGSQVVATGTLFGAHTAHHHTPVLLTVSTLSARQE